MKSKLILAALIVFAASLSVPAQVTVGGSLSYDWPQATTTGQLGNYLFLNNQIIQRPANWIIDFAVTGTAPLACTFQTQGSSDHLTWYNIDASPVTCTASGVDSITGKPARYVRVNVVTYTPGDGTTSVVFHYTGGR